MTFSLISYSYKKLYLFYRTLFCHDGKNKWKISTLVMVLALILISGIGSGLLILDRLFPPSFADRSSAAVIIAADGTPLRAFADTTGVWRYPVNSDQVSKLYIEALLTYEDRWFYFHPGVNPFAIIRAFYQNLVQGRIVSGGSTLTMQVARILYPLHRINGKQAINRQSLTNKLKQILRAVQLEYHLSKDEILALYLTHAPFGSNIEGVWAASQTWLGKNAQELTHAEAALLAVLPQAPSFYRPDRHADRAEKARDKVLNRLDYFGIWSHETITAAKKEPVIAFRFQSPMVAPLATRRLHFQYPKAAIIQSCLDFDLQVHVEDIIALYISSLPDHQSGAILVVNHKTLKIVAYAGSADFTSHQRKGHVDMVQALRSPGSTLKPFLYCLAMDDGLIHSHSLLLDTPRFQQKYMPGNFAGGFTGPVTVAKALRLSLNIPAVQVLEAYGSQKFHDKLKNGGARFRLDGRPNLSIILGGMGTDLESLVTLYTALGREGKTGRPRLKKNDPIQERYLMSPGAAYIIRQLLSRPMPGREGISRLSGHIPVAWKTGTSYGFRDAWAIGLMGDYTAGVWVGRPDGTPSPGQYGAVTAIPLLRLVLESLPVTEFGNIAMPDSVERKNICWPTGLLEQKRPVPSGESSEKLYMKPYTKPYIKPRMNPCMIRHKAWILNHQVPTTMTENILGNAPLLQTLWINKEGKRATPLCGGVEKISLALWPKSAEPWLPITWRRSHLIPPPSENCPDIAPLYGNSIKIISVSDQSILTIPPGQKKMPRIPLETLGGDGHLYWFLNRTPLKNVNASGFLMPGPGAYELAVMDENGNCDKISFQIISL